MTENNKSFYENFIQYINNLVNIYAPAYTDIFVTSIALSLILIFSLMIHIFIHSILRQFIVKKSAKNSNKLAEIIVSRRFFSRLSYLLQGIVFYFQVKLWLFQTQHLMHFMERFCKIWILFFGLLTLFSILNFLQNAMSERANRTNFPLRGLIQTSKLATSILVGLLAISVLLDVSPTILLSGFGALSAVLLLVFKDPILGLVAGIQLSANKMLSVGDWLEMPKYGADGDVIEIALTTVKVQNWDKTITTIPTHALISDSFKNWRGMAEAGGRRIKRSVLIETSSIKFLSEQMLHRLREVPLISNYLDQKVQEIEKVNHGVEAGPLNMRQLTNLGTFREYLVAYLSSHPKIRRDMTLIVRQLEPSNDGLPIEIYAFTTTTDWNSYEDIQSDIFDHILSVLPEFGLRAHEAPTGSDLRALSALQN